MSRAWEMRERQIWGTKTGPAWLSVERKGWTEVRKDSAGTCKVTLDVGLRAVGKHCSIQADLVSFAF